MTDQGVKRLALILAINAEIEGMKAENAQREQLGNSVAYGDYSFQIKADELREIANKTEEQL